MQGSGRRGRQDLDADAQIEAAKAQGRDVLSFKCRPGKPSAAPGSGKEDSVQQPEDYADLAAATDRWRDVFSDMWDAEAVVVWGRTYRTHQHAFQSAKFIAAGLSEAAAMFTVDSGDPIGQGAAHLARRAGNNVAKLTAKQWALWEAARPQMKDDIYAAKFREGSLAAKVLRATNNALLVNNGAMKVVCTRLMQRRDALLER